MNSAAGLGQTARLGLLLTAGYAIHHLILLIDRAMATELGPGNAAALNYAYHLALVVGQVSGLAVSTVLFPRLAEQMSAGNTGAVKRSVGDALCLVGLIALPAGAALIALRLPLIRLLLEHGTFDAAATAIVSSPLVWYTVAVLADALGQPLWRVVYVQQRAGTVLAVNGLQTGLRFGANLLLIPAFGPTGLALSALLGLAVQALVLGWLVHRRLGLYLPLPWWQDAGRITLATAACFVTMTALLEILPVNLPLLQLLLTGIPGGLAYLLALALLGTFNLGGYKNIWHRSSFVIRRSSYLPRRHSS